MTVEESQHSAMPKRRVFFQVLINYMEKDENSDSQMLESVALKTIGEADDIIRNTTERFSTKYPECSVIELGPEQLEDDEQYHILIKTGDKVLVKLGIVAVDYTGVTLH